MSTVVNDVLKRAHSLFARDVKLSLNEVEARLDRKMTMVEQVLRETALQINHQQMQVLDEVKGRTKNTGVMHLSEKEIIAKIFSGAKMYLDPRDIAVVPHLVLDTIWEHRITAAWLRAVGENDVVLDIGANFGYYGVIAAQKTSKKKSKVVMFEANPNLIPYIKKTLDVNWLNEQSVVENLAVADKPGELTLHVLKDYIGSSSIYAPEELEYMKTKMHLETQEAIKVKAVSIDDYCKSKGIKTVNLIKMDIEGYEDKAYAGMRKMVKASPDLTMFIEFTPQGYKDPKGFYDQMLEDFGNVYHINDDGYLVKQKKTDYDSVIGEADDWVMPVFSKKSDLASR